MATKSEIRNYANRNNVSMAEAKQHFISEAIKNAKSNIGQMQCHGSVKLPLNNYGHLVFERTAEIGKMMQMVLNDPPAYDIKSNATDFAQLWSNDEAGFLIAVVPRQGDKWLAKTTNVNQVKEVLDTVKVQRINNDWTMLSTYISADIAYAKFETIFNTFNCAFVGYTTPKNLSTLSEDVALIKQLRVGKSAKQFATA